MKWLIIKELTLSGQHQVCLLITMAICLTYSPNYLKTSRELAKSTSNFPLSALETSVRGKIIACGIRKNHQNRPYRGSKGGWNIFNQIHTLFTHARQQQHAGNPNSLPSVNIANLKTIQLVKNTTGKKLKPTMCYHKLQINYQQISWLESWNFQQKHQSLCTYWNLDERGWYNHSTGAMSTWI